MNTRNKLVYRKKFIALDIDASYDHKFCQILTEDIFGDKIKTLDVAKDFNEMTKSGKRQDTGLAAYQIWARSILKKIIKPEFYILVAGFDRNTQSDIQ